MSAGGERQVLVYDVGGSHISAALCQEAGFRLRSVVRGALPTEQSAAAFVEVLHGLAERAAAGHGLAGICGASLAMPGPFDYANGVSQMVHKLEYLLGFDLKSAIAARFGWSPSQVSFLNDADSFLLGEVGNGAAKGSSRAIGFTLGTGIGSAFAVNGELVTEGPGVPPGGEIWNVPFPLASVGETGPVGSAPVSAPTGIVEDALSTRGLQAAYLRLTGTQSEVAAIAARAETDASARQVFAEFGEHLSRVLTETVGDFHPDTVVLGGGIARAAHLFLPSALARLDGRGIAILVSTLMDDAPLTGAGVHWFQADGKRVDR